MFLGNHDELDLGRLTEAQRQKVFAALNPIPPCSCTSAVFAAVLHR
jgi:hypothetical protein